LIRTSKFKFSFRGLDPHPQFSLDENIHSNFIKQLCIFKDDAPSYVHMKMYVKFCLLFIFGCLKMVWIRKMSRIVKFEWIFSSKENWGCGSSPRNENLNLLVRIKFLNLLYIHIYLNKNWKIYWSEQSLFGLGPENRC
jgi:hypothetical protein